MAEQSDAKILARFERYEEFSDLQKSELSMDLNSEPTPEESSKEAVVRHRLYNILAEYQEQAYLLDPFLESLVTPLVDKLKAHAQDVVRSKRSLGPKGNLASLSMLLYSYIKFRGYKAIMRFFPHEVSDLSIALEFAHIVEQEEGLTTLWPLHYAVLLWISLICMIPFDLVQFDEAGQEGMTTATVEAIAKRSLGKSGLNREGASVLLSRLYVRKDTHTRLPGFLQWSTSVLQTGQDVFEALGALRTIYEVVKICPEDILIEQIPTIFEIAQLVERNPGLMSNSTVRKLHVKLISRAGLRLLPATPRIRQHKGRVLSTATDLDVQESPEDDDEDVPEEIERVLQDIFHALQDRDTVVRWSAAKGVARVSERLPSDFASQVVNTVIGLFSIHSLGVASLYDIPAVAESTWHGACLACAELTRRGLIEDEKLGELIAWVSKALYFDIRRGAHSIGSSVRDAAAYILWSLARAYPTSVIEPFAGELAQRLVTVSVYDREVHIRRAVSAAYQEYVGRTGIFPHGIDVLRKTDFFAVGIRRNAFLIAAPQVAEHTEYRQSLLDHLLSIALRHWDPAMRQVAAQSLRKICELDLVKLGPVIARRARDLLKMPDSTDVHGGLLALAELSNAYSESDSSQDFEQDRQEIFTFLADAPIEMIESPRHDIVTTAACNLIASSISLQQIRSDAGSHATKIAVTEGLVLEADDKVIHPKQPSIPRWRRLIDLGLKHRNNTVQEAAANAMAVVSRLVDCSLVVQRDFRSGSPIHQQSLTRVLGQLDYTAHRHGLPWAVQCLLDSVKASPPLRMQNVEARRNCFTSMATILSTVAPQLCNHLKPTDVCSMFDALLFGLEDYTIDERGDVGSWVRIACIQGLTTFSTALFSHSSDIPDFAEYLPAERYHAAVAGILKQGVERLDNVRQQAGEHVLLLLAHRLPSVPNADAWRFRGEPLIRELFMDDPSPVGWQESSWLFPKAVRILEIPEYRRSVLLGLLLSVGSKTHSTQLPVSNSLTTYVRALPASTSEKKAYDVLTLTEDLVSQANSQWGSNNNVVPVLQLFNLLLEADALGDLAEEMAGVKSLQALLSLATRGVSKLKNVQRIQECMKVVANLLSIPQLFDSCLPQLIGFLSHRFPTVRAATAEYLYLVLQSRDLGRDTDEVEELLLETEWLSQDMSVVEHTSQEVVEMLS